MTPFDGVLQRACKGGPLCTQHNPVNIAADQSQSSIAQIFYCSIVCKKGVAYFVKWRDINLSRASVTQSR